MALRYSYRHTAACIVLFSILCSVASVLAYKPNSCSAVRSEYLRQGFTDEVPEYQIPGNATCNFVVFIF